MGKHHGMFSTTGDHGETSRHPRSQPGRARHDENRYRLVMIAASAGGVVAIGDVLSSLPADFPVPIAVVLHRSTRTPGILPKILARRTCLRVKAAEQSEALRPGTVYVAPADRHLKVHGDTFTFTDGQRIRYVLSSANPLFESAAEALGGRVIAVVLTGGDRDATDGVQAVRSHGGIVLAQDEATAAHFAMPRSAIETGCVDRVLPLEAIGPELVNLVQTHS